MKLFSKILIFFTLSMSTFAEEKPQLINIGKRLLANPKEYSSFLKGDMTLDGKLVFHPGREYPEGRGSENWVSMLTDTPNTSCVKNRGFYLCYYTNLQNNDDNLYVNFIVYKKKRYPFDTLSNLLKAFYITIGINTNMPKFCGGDTNKSRLCTSHHENFSPEIIELIPDTTKKSKLGRDMERLIIIGTNDFIYFILGRMNWYSFDKDNFDRRSKGYYVFQNEDQVVPVNDRIFHMKYLYGKEKAIQYFKKGTKTPLIIKSGYWPEGKNNVSENFRKYLEMERDYLKSQKTK